MKLNKLFAGIAASAVAASALAATASAQLIFPSPEEAHPGASTAGNWLVQVYNIGNEAEGKPPTDYGIDVTSIARVEVTFTVCEDSRDWFEGGCGGSVVVSSNGSQHTDEEWAKYNWPSREWWGVIDDDLGLATQDPAKKCVTEKVGDYTYKIVAEIPADERPLAKSECVQIGLQEWGDVMNDYMVTDLSIFNDAGEKLISFDFYGNPTLGSAAAAPEASAPAEDATDAPATSAPATGDVAGATDSSKGSPDTGIEDVAVVAGLAIVAGGAVLVSKKRK